eukprot:5172684-Prymnesium_polylepis.1
MDPTLASLGPATNCFLEPKMRLASSFVDLTAALLTIFAKGTKLLFLGDRAVLSEERRVLRVHPGCCAPTATSLLVVTSERGRIVSTFCT